MPTLQLCGGLRKAQSSGSFGGDVCQTATNTASPRATADTALPACSAFGMRNIAKGYLCPNSTSDFESCRGPIKLIRLSLFNFTYQALSFSLIGILCLLISKTLWNQRGLNKNKEKNREKRNRTGSRKKKPAQD